MTLEIFPVGGIGNVEPGDDLAEILAARLRSDPAAMAGDILVVTHKIVSKAEGAVVSGITSDGDYRRLVEQETASIVRRRGDLIISQTKHGFICANAGVDRSNVEPGKAVLLPVAPDRSAHRLRQRLQQILGISLAVIITDTFGRPWRRGLVDVAIGVSGMPAIVDYRGTKDMFGRILEASEVAVVDEIAAAADLVMGKADRIPAALVRGLELSDGDGRAAELVRPTGEDMFR